MNSTKKTLLVAILVPVLGLIAFVTYAKHRTTTVVLDIPYNQAERLLLEKLTIDKYELIERKVAQSHVSGELEKSLTMGTHTHYLLHYIPGERIHFCGESRYDIFASGVERIEFDLKKKSENTTSIKVDYFETTELAGILPITYKPGGKQESHIITTIFKKEDANQASQTIGSEASPQSGR